MARSPGLDTCCTVVASTEHLCTRHGSAQSPHLSICSQSSKKRVPVHGQRSCIKAKKAISRSQKMCPSLGLWINCSFCVFLFYVHVNPTKQWGKNRLSDLAPICRGTVLTYSIWRMYTSDMFSELIFSSTIPKSSEGGALLFQASLKLIWFVIHGK